MININKLSWPRSDGGCPAVAAVVAVSELRGGDGGEVHGARHQDVVSRPVPVDR